MTVLSKPLGWLIGLAGFLVIGTIPTASAAATITIGGMAPIVDGGAGDLNAAADIIDFMVVGEPATGYDLKGRVDLGFGDAFIGLLPGVGAGVFLNLTNFSAGRPLGAAGGPLTITVSHVHAAPANPVNAYDGIRALIGRAGPSPAFPAGTDVLVSYQGFVNGLGIGGAFGPVGSPPYPPLLPGIGFTAPYLSRVDSVCGGNGVAALPPPPPPMAAAPCVVSGPPWTLRQELTFSLGAAGSNFILTDSATVGVSAVPEPSAILLFGLGALGYRRRRPR